ncbi:hypothetical protein COEREDRAFT_8770 [Coemansia reversa NRRL 1564]|uniref:Centromere protein S n=1 Tax=Coemansia reversa (strain ATCC 12441 / NRRL 1564) TaxID=763665 RepID=A0A2G5BAU4_COERN|nr:hypothetical protein COEREDRAFT_8770 [Coemansia reversa NRRL 1564]|eukprot:PIA16112.1 hypothetical protein COEREDRAFT_8770 [Coemansia reversa NRRL 1564]
MNTDASDPRAAIWLAVAQLCSADENMSATKFTPAFVDALSRVVLSQAETMASDLECFARHAKRAKISVDDVKLCARRNNSMTELLSTKADAIKQASKDS